MRLIITCRRGVFLRNTPKENSMKQLSLFAITAVLGLLSIGCYTQFKLVDQTPPPAAAAPQEEWVVDSATGDTVKVIKQTDTIQENNSQTCVWERDLMGYPYLRCYDSFYPRDWFWYNNSPWWYRNDPYWYDYNRCPRYYFYDPSCGCCRYTGTSYYDGGHRYPSYHHGGSGETKSGPAIPGGSSIPPRTRGIPDPRGSKPVPSSSAPQSSSDQSKSASASDSGRQSGQLILNPEENRQPRIVNQRRVGVPGAGAQSVPAAAPSAPPPSASAPPPPKTSAPASGESGAKQSDSGSSSGNQNTQQQESKPHQRHNPRSW